MVKLIGALSRLNPVKVLLIGDFMLDTYTMGKIRRISPEAPVSVLNVQKEESRPGGAGNVALNLVSLGAEICAVGRIGPDEAGQKLKAALEKEEILTHHLLVQQGFKTPVKNRLIADAQQVLRVDFETFAPLDQELEREIIKRIPTLLAQVQIVAISDYGKGFLSTALLAKVIEEARKKEIPVIVDPKGEDFAKYTGATIIKPNLSEAYAAARLAPDTSLERVATTILHQCNVDMLLITRSEAGMTLFHKSGERVDFPVRSKEVKDVTGAGDTVLALICLALANGLDIKEAAHFANIAAGLAIERLGCARINLAEMAERLFEFNSDNKIFDEEHLFALEQVLQGKDYLVFGIESKEGMTTALFRSIRELSQRHPQAKLIVYMREDAPDEEFISLLSSLTEVDFIVVNCESLKTLCARIHPHQVYLIDAGRLLALPHADALLTT